MLIQETRHALRLLRLAPAFTAAVILTLALGIGATTSIFTLVYAVLLKSLPVVNPGELYRLRRETHRCYLAGYSQDHEFSLVSYDLYRHLTDNTRGFSELARLPSKSTSNRADLLPPWRQRMGDCFPVVGSVGSGTRNAEPLVAR
jgi:hypothetical protein